MFGKDKPSEKIRGPAPSAEPDRPHAAPPVSADKPEAMSSIGADITIVGKIVGTGTVKIYGRIEGEVQASEVTIAEGAMVEGKVIGQSVTIGGQIKGTIHAVRAKLLGTAKVEGDIFHRSLSIDEDAMFEGSSRRDEDPIGNHKPGAQPAATTLAFNAPAAARDVDGQHGASDIFALREGRTLS